MIPLSHRRLLPLIEKLELRDADGRMRPVLKIEIPLRVLGASESGWVPAPCRKLEASDGARGACPAVRAAQPITRVGQFDRQVVAEASLDDLDPRLADRFRGADQR